MKKSITADELKQFGISLGFILWLVVFLSYLKHNAELNAWGYAAIIFFVILALVQEKALYVFTLFLSVFLWVKTVKGFTVGSQVINVWLFGIAHLFVIAALVKPRVLKPVHYVLIEKAATAVGWFNTRVLLIVLYYVIITPIGVIMRLAGKDPLNRKIDAGSETYWVPRAHIKASKESLEKQF